MSWHTKSVILPKHSAGVQLQSCLVTPGRFTSTCCISCLPNCTHVEQSLGCREGVRFSYLYRLNTKYCTLLKLSLFSLDCYCHRLLYWMPSLNAQNVLRMLTSCSISITTSLGVLNEKAYSANIYECPVWSQIAKFNACQYCHIYGIHLNSRMGLHSATLFSLTWRALPGELHQLLLCWYKSWFKRKSFWNFSPILCEHTTWRSLTVQVMQQAHWGRL